MHVIQLNVRGGVPAAIDTVFGKVLLPNALVPPWLTEGMAVLHESGPGHGRNASALFDMYARAMVLEGGLFSLPEVSNQPLDWPLGNMWYLLGGRFLSFLHERSGAEGLRDFLAAQGRYVWPFAIGVVAEDTLGGKDFPALWGEFGRALAERYEAQMAEVRPLAGDRAGAGSPGAGRASSTRAGRRTAPSSPTGIAASTARRGSGGPRPPGRTWGSPPRSPPTGPSRSSRPPRPSSPSRITTGTTGCGATSGGWTSPPGAGSA